MSFSLLGTGRSEQAEIARPGGQFHARREAKMKRTSRDFSTSLGMTKEWSEMLARLSGA
jgi:hypothetical protein